MIDRAHLPVSREAELLELSGASVYYMLRLGAEVDLALMQPIDESHVPYPFAGTQFLRDRLNREGFRVAASMWQR